MKDLEKLRVLTELKYQASQNDLRLLVQEEQRIRQDIDRLNESASDVDRETANRMGAIGADIVWQSWLGRMRKQLNTQLAQVLAQKERHLTKARKEFSRVLVARELEQKASEDARKIDRNLRLEKAIESSLSSHHNPGA